MVAEVQVRCPRSSGPSFWTSEWDELLAGDDALAAESAQIRASLTPDDPINIQYTSGTTGFPKGATLSHRNILNNGYFVAGLQALSLAIGCVFLSRFTIALAW